ncbi:ABC transporter ATP-binding protein [Microvirga puerhi]|uniref:ABC transporter ATP-binding protein n=1 Tax=Microvirga puerhi TaxID=2876078 RepID=A0ABS7VTC5_9HYPH|nr:ABC transporter ATP-binding protein [Microvirga puerhi]MBZ6078429.1 ABC transporter ATP-binding protein [Microvirga puerhi]
MARVELRALAKSFGAVPVLSGIDLDIADGEFLTLIGPSGCGKSTLIRMIAGLEPQTSGSISIGGVSIDHLRPHERRVAMVFQSYALYPHMSVFSNIALPLTMQRLSLWERLPLIKLLSSRRRRVMPEIAREVRAIAEQLQIEHLLDRRPARLSGGQRQRVALGRAMVRHPDVFLMDEPLSNLDAKLRVHMRTELAELHQRLKTTFIYVTHDQVEAMTMSDRVAMMDAGRILQLGTPTELYERPINIKVASFIGSPAINLLKAKVGHDGYIELMDRRLTLQTPLEPGADVTLGIRPEAMFPASSEEIRTGRASLPASLRRKENLGSEFILHFDVAGPASVVARVPAGPVVQAVNGSVELSFDVAACHIFNEQGERIEPNPLDSCELSRPRTLVASGGGV